MAVYLDATEQLSELQLTIGHDTRALSKPR